MWGDHFFDESRDKDLLEERVSNFLSSYFLCHLVSCGEFLYTCSLCYALCVKMLLDAYLLLYVLHGAFEGPQLWITISPNRRLYFGWYLGIGRAWTCVIGEWVKLQFLFDVSWDHHTCVTKPFWCQNSRISFLTLLWPWICKCISIWSFLVE